MDEDDAIFAAFMNEVTTMKTTKMKKMEGNLGTPEEIIERLTNMRYDPKQGEGSAYLVLGISPESSESEVTKAYRKLSVLIHPDKCKLEKASEAFQLVAKAYADTKDPNYQDKYKDIVGEAKKRVRKAREKENQVRAKKGEDPLETEGHDFDQEVLRECERMTSKSSGETAEKKNEVYEANMKRWAEMAKESKKARRDEDNEKKKFDRQRDKRAAGWQVFMQNVKDKRYKVDLTVGRVGAADIHHKREERGWMHQGGTLKAEVDLDDKKVLKSDTQVGQAGIDRSYMQKWR